MKILLGQIHNEVTSDLRKMSLLWLQLTLVIGNLPVLEGQFFCAFTAFSKTLETNATRSTNGVSCATPHTDSLPPIPPGERKPPQMDSCIYFSLNASTAALALVLTILPSLARRPLHREAFREDEKQPWLRGNQLYVLRLQHLYLVSTAQPKEWLEFLMFRTIKTTQHAFSCSSFIVHVSM